MKFFPRQVLALALLIALSPAVLAEPPPGARRAEDAYADGDYAKAADMFLHAAEEASGSERPALMLRAAEAGIQGNRRDIVMQALRHLDERDLNTDERMRANLVRVEMGQFSDEPSEVLRRLPPPADSAPADVAQRVWFARAEAYLRHGDTIEAVRAFAMRERRLKNSRDIERSRTRIWQLLRSSPVMSNELLAAKDLDPTTRGWFDLAQLDRRRWTDTLDREIALARWEDQYPDHPASDDVLEIVRENPPLLAPKPPPASTVAITPPPTRQAPIETPAGVARRDFNTVALILPLTGSLAAPARAVRDGFVGAYYEQPEPRPKLQIYDSGAGNESVLALYERAIAEGADLVIGPLQKESVATLARMTSPRQPVLALNYLDGGDTAPENFFQFGLSPEDEARQVAERAIADGRSRAVALIPEGDWGTRTLAAFRERFDSLGGTVLDAQAVGTRNQDHAAAVARLLKIGSPPPGSKERVLFEPRPGNDPDFVFLAAQPAQARVLRPHFRFYGAGHLPIYATSHVFEGVPSPARDSDLEGVVFCDMPWTIGTGEFAAQRDRLRSQWPDSYNRYPRLYALGYDAVRLLPVLAGREDAGRIASATGSLKLGNDGRVRRSLLWARFENGTPKLLGP